MQKELIQPPRGMRDFSPKEMEEREALKELILSEYKSFGYRPIGTPVLENIEVLTAKGGEEADKLMYRVLKRGDQLEKVAGSSNPKELSDLGLRFDLTVPLCRYAATHANDLPNTARLMRIDPVWRADRPQKGRFREFVQCDVDIINAEGNAYEIELLTIAERILNKLDFKARIRISDRRLLQTVLSEKGAGNEEISKIRAAIDKVDKVGKEKVLEEIKPLTSSIVYMAIEDLLEGKNIFSTEGALPIMNSINDIINGLKELNPETKAVFDPLLMRGLDYYTGTVFEVELEGLNVSAAGGGRYDNLIGVFSGKSVPAVGISLGFERILTLLEDQKRTLSEGTQKRIRMFSENKTESELQKKAMELREKGLIVDVDFSKRKFDKKIKAAENDGIRFIITDFDADTVTLKDISRKQTDDLKIKDLIQRVNFEC